MHSRASLALGIGVMIVSGWAVISAMEWPWKAKLFPLVIGIPVFLLAAAEVLWVLFGTAPKDQAMDFQLSAHLPAEETLKRTLVAVAWIVGFFALIVLLGFPIAVALFVFLYLKLQGREGWVLCSVFTLAVWAAFYGLFDVLLHLPFPEGWIQSWIGSS
jgi:hypothetical protein